MEHLSSPEQLQEHYHQAVELAYIVADTLSVASLKQLWEHSDFSTLDKQMLQMLRRGVDTVKEKTADALVAEMHTTREQATQSLVKYEPHKVSALAPLFRKRLDKMRKLFAIPQVRQLYFSEFHQRKDHREILANGKEGLEQVRAVEQEIQETKKQRHLLMVEKFFTGVKMSDVEKSTINEELVELEETLQTLHTKKHTLLQMRETATLWRLEKLKKMKRKDGYVMTPTRQSIFNIAVDQFLEGNHILLKGDTGTGKTAIAIQISKYLEELSAGKIQTLQIDGKKLEAEAKDPEKLRKAEQLVFSGNPFTTQSDLIGKDKLKGTIEMEFQYSKLLTAFMTGRVLILDELDSIPGDVLYRVKHLFEQKPLSLYAPQEDGGAWKPLLQTKIIATANIHSENKYRDKEKLPVPIQDNFIGIEVPYMPESELYDFALVELINQEGFITSVGKDELLGEQLSNGEWTGIVLHLLKCIKKIEQLFSGEITETINGNSQYELKNAIWTMRSHIPLFREFKGKHLNARIKTAVVDFIAKATDPDDRKVLVKVFSEHNFLTQKDITSYRHRGETLSLAQVVHLSEADLKASIIAESSASFSETSTPFMDPIDVAELDPYHQRNLEHLQLQNPFRPTKNVLQTLQQTLVATGDEKLGDFADSLSEKIEQADKVGGMTSDEIAQIMRDFYELYDKDNDVIVKTRDTLSALGEDWKKVAQDIEEKDKKKLFGKKFDHKRERIPQSTVPSAEHLTNEEQLKQGVIERAISSTNARIQQLKKDGYLVYGEGIEKYNVQSYLTETQKKALKNLEEKDITDIQIFPREAKGEKYAVITYKEKGVSYTTFQVPQWLRKMKYGKTYSGSQLAKFKNERRGVRFLDDAGLQTTIDKEWCTVATESLRDGTGTPLVDTKLYAQNEQEIDFVKRCALQGKGMMTITDSIILGELIKETFGEDYVGEGFISDKALKNADLKKKKEEIEEHFKIKFDKDKADDGYLNRDYLLYQGKDGKWYGWLRGFFRSGYSALCGVASVVLGCILGGPYSGVGSRSGG